MQAHLTHALTDAAQEEMRARRWTEQQIVTAMRAGPAWRLACDAIRSIVAKAFGGVLDATNTKGLRAAKAGRLAGRAWASDPLNVANSKLNDSKPCLRAEPAALPTPQPTQHLNGYTDASPGKPLDEVNTATAVMLRHRSA